MTATPRGERTRQAYLAAAKRVFAEKGYFNAKISDISAAAGRSHGSFYNYFDNKDALLLSLAEEFAAEVLTRARNVPRGDPYEVIKQTVTIYYSTYRAYLPTLIGLFQLSMADPKFDELWQQVRRTALENAMAITRKAHRDGFARGLDEHAATSAIVSMLEYFCWTWLARDGEPGFAPIPDAVAVENLAQIWYRSLYFPGTSKDRPT